MTEANATTSGVLEKTPTIEKLRQMCGSLMLASAVEVLIGAGGLVAPLMRRVGPLTVAPTIMLIALPLYKIPLHYARPCPLMAIASAVLVLIFSLYLQRVEIPITCRGNKTTLPIFKIFPVLLSILIVWSVAGVLTAVGVFPDDPRTVTYLARTDAKMDLVRATPWILPTYPGQFGMPSFNLAAFVGFTAAVLSSVVESVGDYFTAARSCEVRPPPQHAVSRGLLMEGLGSVLSGAYGACHATASYSTNIALLSLCRTASRSVLVLSGVLLVLVSFVGKVAALLSTMPEPILSGVMLVMLGLLLALGLSTLQHADLTSTRNLLVLGVPLFTAMVVPAWIEAYPETVETGSGSGDQVLRVLLGTPMILGGVLACLLDNTVSGTDKERGMHEWNRGMEKSNNSITDPETAAASSDAHARQEQDIYGWKWYPTLFQKFPLLRYVPFLPSSEIRRQDSV